MEIVPESELPSWLKYPPEYLRLIKDGLVKFTPWYLLDAKLARLRYKGLQKRYPDKRLFAFAARLDNDDIACWEARNTVSVIVMHDFVEEGYTRRRVFGSFWDWLRASIDDMVQHEP